MKTNISASGKGLMSDNGYPYPTEAELKNIFASSCVEAAARKLGCSTYEMYERMKKVDLVNKYIYPLYDVLHTESRENVTQNIIDCLINWEKDAN